VAFISISVIRSSAGDVCQQRPNSILAMLTDFPAPVPERDPTDWLDLAGGSPSICNVVTASDECQNRDIERQSD
jgi:hypothetical protein